MIKSLKFWYFIFLTTKLGHHFSLAVIFKFFNMSLRRLPFSPWKWQTSQGISPITLISFRRNKNIRDNLVRSALRQNLPAPAGTFSCFRARCYTCSFLNSATSISGPKSNLVIRHNFTCTSSNIIYCISCSKCWKLYIGETGDVYLTDLLNTFVP